MIGLCLAILGVIGGQVDSAAPESSFSVLIETVSGPMTLTSPDGSTRALNPQSDRGTWLSTGDWLKPAQSKSCAAKIWYYDHYVPIQNKPFVVLAAPKGTSNTLSSYFARGGLEKWAPSAIYYPSSANPVLPSLLRVHFVTVPGQVSLAIYSAGKPVFGPVLISGSLGEYGSAAMSNALTAAVQGGKIHFGVQMKSGSDLLGEMNFDSLDPETIKILEAKLAHWTSEGGLVSYFGRAMILMQDPHHFDYEAYDQYEGALKIAPQSTELNRRVKLLGASLFKQN